MNAAVAPGLSRNLIQVAYVTTDFDRALRDFAAQLGVPKFFELRDLPVQTGPEREARLHVGLAWSGGVQIEIIQPLVGDDAVYRDWLPASGYALKFHHVAHLLETEADLDGVDAQLQRQGVNVVIRGAANGGATRYLYGDFRATLGHYVEYIYYSPPARQFFEMIPRAG